MTIEMMKRFGVTVTPVENGWLVPGNQSYVPRDLAIEGDWSQAVFFPGRRRAVPGAGFLHSSEGPAKALHTGGPSGLLPVSEVRG